MALVTDAEVKEIIDTELTTTTFITTAHLIVTEDLGDAGYSSDRQKQIELYLAAHFTALMEEGGGITRRRMGDSDESYALVKGNGLMMTRYGQQAMALDTSGILKGLNNTSLPALFTVVGSTDTECGQDMANPKFPHTITFWAVSVNGNGDYTYSSPVTMKGRWEDRQDLFIDGALREVLSKAVVYTETPVTLSGYVANGDYALIADPTTVPTAYQVRATSQIPSLNGRKQTNKVWCQMAKIGASVGPKYGGNTFAGRHAGNARAEMAAIVKELKRRMNAIKEATPAALEEALTPTFAKAIYYTPVASGQFRASGYMELREGLKGPEIEIGFGKEGNPAYAAYVHEMVNIPHAAPTRAKFLQSAIEEDIDDIPKRIAAALRRVAKGGRARKKQMDTLLRGLAQVLINGGVASGYGGTSDYGVFISNVPTSPGAVIVLNRAGGLPDNPKWAVDYPAIQAIVRGKENASDAAYVKIKAVKDVLLGRESGLLPAVAGITTPEYVTSITLMGNILPLGRDDNNRILYSVNFRLIVEPVTTGNRTPLQED